MSTQGHFAFEFFREFPARKSPDIPETPLSGGFLPGYPRQSPKTALFSPENRKETPLFYWICGAALFCCGKIGGKAPGKCPGKRKAAGVSSRQPPRRCRSNTGWPPVLSPPQALKACHSQSHTMLCGHIRNGYTSISAPRPAFPALKAPVPP